MSEVTRSLSSPILIQYYGFDGVISSKYFEISHNITDVTYDNESLTVSAILPHSLVSFLKNFGVIFRDTFSYYLGENTIAGWTKTEATNTSIKRGSGNKLGSILIEKAAASGSVFLSRKITVPRYLRTDVDGSRIGQNYKTYFVSEILSGSGVDLKVRTSFSDTAGISSDRIVTNWTTFSSSPIDIGNTISSENNASFISDFFINLDIGMTDAGAGEKVLSIASLVMLPTEFSSPTTNHIPFMSRYNSSGSVFNQDISKEGLIVSFSTSDGSSEKWHVFRGCTASFTEAMPAAEDCRASVSFSYKSMSIGEDWS